MRLAYEKEIVASSEKKSRFLSYHTGKLKLYNVHKCISLRSSESYFKENNTVAWLLGIVHRYIPGLCLTCWPGVIAYFAHCYPRMLTIAGRKLKTKEWLPLSIFTSLNIAFFIYIIYKTLEVVIAFKLDPGKYMINIIIPGLSLIYECIALLLITIAFSQVEDEMAKEPTSMDIGRTVIEKLRAIRRGLSPLLFLVYFMDGWILTHSAYSLLSEPMVPIVLLVKSMLLLLKLFYLSLVIDDCYQGVSSFPLKLR